MNKKRNLIWIISISVILFLIVFLTINYQNNKNKAASEAYETETVISGSLNNIIGGTGEVRSKQSATLLWQTSGIVENVNVSENQEITKGMQLANLDNSSLSQNIISAQAELISLRQQMDDLYKNADLNLAQAELDVIEAQNTLDDLLEDRVWLDYPRCDQNSIDLYWDEYQAQLDNVEDLEAKYASPMWKDYVKDLLPQARHQRDTAYANYSYCIEEREESEIAEYDTRINRAEANLAVAQERLDSLKKNNPAPEDIAALEARIAAANAAVNTMLIEAPFSGKITQVNILPGDQVNAGEAAFRMDDLSELLVDVNISEVDINLLQVGQPAQLSFDSAYGREYEGTVSKIASVGTNNQGVVEFAVTISLDNPDENIKPGMSAVVNIVVNEFQNALLVPNQAIRVVEGQRVVYLLKNDGSLQEVPLTIGITSSSHSQVLDGELKEGDKIVLSPPEDPVIMIGNNGTEFGQ